jgi:hypothetical protein
MKKRSGSLSLKKVSYRSVSGGGGGGFLAPPRTKEATATTAKDVDGDMLLADREDFVRDLRSEAVQRDGECDIPHWHLFVKLLKVQMD